MNKFDYYLYKFVGKAIRDFELIENGDRILVCLSGGKDSYVLLHVLERLQKRAPVNFSIHLLHIDGGFDGFDNSQLLSFMKESGHKFTIHRANIGKEYFENKETTKDLCFFCARQRRSIIYRIADELKMTKIALGHHSDDLIESFLLSICFNGKMETMAPKLLSPRKNFHIIRPLIYVQERVIEDFSKKQNYPIIDDKCPHYEGEGAKRKLVKELLNNLEDLAPGSKTNILKSLSNINVKRLLDKRLW